MTLAAKSAVKINGESIQVDPLFQRLSLAGKTDLVTALQHELSCYPLSLFETAELLHEAQKAAFADSIWINLKQKDPPAPENPRYVGYVELCSIEFLGHVDHLFPQHCKHMQIM